MLVVISEIYFFPHMYNFNNSVLTYDKTVPSPQTVCQIRSVCLLVYCTKYEQEEVTLSEFLVEKGFALVFASKPLA